MIEIDGEVWIYRDTRDSRHTLLSTDGKSMMCIEDYRLTDEQREAIADARAQSSG